VRRVLWKFHMLPIADIVRMAVPDLAHDGPAFLEVMIDPDAGVYPMVGPGATYAQMITGEFIASRGGSPVETGEVSATSMF